MSINKVGIEIPQEIQGYRKDFKPYAGAFETEATAVTKTRKIRSSKPGDSKILENLEEAISKSGLKDGMTISFHHHLRNGDFVLNKVMDVIAGMGIKDLTIAASSLTNAHEPLLGHIKSGVVSGLETSGLRGQIAEEMSRNAIMDKPIIFRSHGARARAIECGELTIDVAFIAAPICDTMGNMNGMEGKNAFGAMGYPMADAEYANCVVAVTDNLVPFPLNNIAIPMTNIDFIVEIDEIGDPSKIATGATRITSNPKDLFIAEQAAKVLIASGEIKEGYSFQAGSGGASLAVCKFLREYMEENKITGSFSSGGIVKVAVDFLEDGLFKSLLDVQTFDAAAAESMRKNPNHVEMSSSMYANPHNKSCVAHQLDVMILSATEIDINFNINSLTASTGMIMGAIGGAQDTAAGAGLTLVVAPSMRGRLPIVMDRVTNVVTPGDTIDVLVTERGVCVNPRRADLMEKFTAAGIQLKDITELKEEVEALTGKPAKNEYTDKIVGVIEYRDGTVIDVIRQIKTKK